MQTMPVETLDPNCRHAVAITRSMAVDYLRIDSICIVQRSKEWEEQSGEMGLIYANAKCVVSATASRNSNGGCYQRKDVFQEDCVLRKVNGCSLITQSPENSYPKLAQLFSDNVEHAPLTRRAWTFQERFLAGCVLHFCAGMILFECSMLMASQHHGTKEYTFKTDIRWDGTMHNVPEPIKKSSTDYKRLRKLKRGKKRITKPLSTWFTSRTTWRPVETEEHKVYRQKESARHHKILSMSQESAQLGMRGAFRFLTSFNGKQDTEQAEFHLRWYEMVEHYSVRGVSRIMKTRLSPLQGLPISFKRTHI